MSVSVTARDYPHARLELFEESDPVGIPAVQDALSALWRMASERAQDEQSAALSRACLWNLVAFHSNPQRARGDSGGEARRITTLLEQVTVAVPARVIHLEEWRDEAAPQPGQEVEAWVSTHCLHSESGPQLVCCEQINAAGYGERGHSHFPALVRALLVPDLPTALLWLDDVPRKGRVLGQLLQMSERMVVDTQHITEPASLLAVHELQRNAPGKLADLGWLRLTALRHLVADFFEPPGRAEQLGALERIGVEVSPAGSNTGLLLLGWLLSRTGYGEVRAVDLGGQGAGGLSRWQARRAGGKPAEVELRVHDDASAAPGEAAGDGGMDGVYCIRIEAGGDTFALHDVDPEHMRVDGPDKHLPHVALREAGEPELVVQALGAPLRDRVYAEALATATELAESQQWTH